MDKVISWIQQDNPDPDDFPTESKENLEDERNSESPQFTPTDLEQQRHSTDHGFNHGQQFNGVDVNFSCQRDIPSLLYSVQSSFAHQIPNQQSPVWQNQFPSSVIDQGFCSNDIQGFSPESAALQYPNLALDGLFNNIPSLETNRFHQQPILQSAALEQFPTNTDFTGLATEASITPNEEENSENGVDFAIDSASLNDKGCLDNILTASEDVPPQLPLGQGIPMDTSPSQIEGATPLTQQQIFNMIRSHFNPFEAEQNISIGADIPTGWNSPQVPLDHQVINNTFPNPQIHYGAQQYIDFATQQLNGNFAPLNFQANHNLLQSPLNMESVAQRMGTMSYASGAQANFNSMQTPFMMPAENAINANALNVADVPPNGSEMIELLVDPREVQKYYNLNNHHQQRSFIPKQFINSSLLGNKPPTQEDLVQQKLKELKAKGNIDEMIDFVFGEAQNYDLPKTRRGRRPKNRFNPYESRQRDVTSPKDQLSSQSDNSGCIPMFGFDSRQIKGSAANDVTMWNRSRDLIFEDQPIKRTGKRKCSYLDDEDERMAKLPRHQL